MYPQILYWKLAPDSLDPAVARQKAEDIVKRSRFDLIYITSHALPEGDRLPQTSPALTRTLEILCEVFHANRRKVMFEHDIRPFVDFYKSLGYTETLHMAALCDGVLDARGAATLTPFVRGSIHTTHTADKDELRALNTYLVDGLFAAFAFRLQDGSDYIFKPETLRIITDRVTLRDGHFEVALGEEFAGYTVALFPSIDKPQFGDRTCPEYMAAEREFFEQMRHFGFDAAATDEWGLVTDTIRPTEEFPHYATSSINMTRHIIDRYRALCGRELAEDMVYLYYHPENRRGVAVATYHNYFSALRSIMAETDAQIYKMAKDVLGRDAFYGVHPTWWGTRDCLFMEAFHNGVYWWEATRDHAQTDEEIIIPFRSSLARAMGRPLWYNMWYSMGTNDVRTFFKETWDNARYGGRTHYLSYECRKENGVLDMADSNALELCSEMEDEIVKLNAFGAAHPDTRVLAIFSYDAFTNPMLSDPGAKLHSEYGKNNARIIGFTEELFRSPCLVDLVPSTEIDRDTLVLNGSGKLAYFGKEYDAVILLVPDGASKKTVSLCTEYAKRGGILLTVGGMEYFSDGTDATAAFATLSQSATEAYPFDVPVFQVLAALDRNGIARGAGDGYALFEDGSVIFTGEGRLPRGNPLSIDTEIGTHRIRFEGSDFLAVRFGDTPEYVFGACTRLEIDGKIYV